MAREAGNADSESDGGGRKSRDGEFHLQTVIKDQRQKTKDKPERSFNQGCAGLLRWGWMRPGHIQRAHALLADLVAGHVKVRPKAQRFRTVDNVRQGVMADVAQNRVKKARADVTGGFDHRRNPGGVAAGSNVLRLAEMSAEMLDDAAELLSGFNDKSRLQVGAVLVHQEIDFLL